MTKKWLDLLSGGGGTATGLKMAGFDTNNLISVELDPKRPNLSRQLCDSHERNVGGLMLRTTVQDLAENHMDVIPDDLYALSASPVCCNYSQAKIFDRGEKPADLEVAIAIAKIVREKLPQFIFIENVPRYAATDKRDGFIFEAFSLLYREMSIQGYAIRIHEVNVADYGVPSSRKRMIVTAARDNKAPALPPTLTERGWLMAVKDLIWDSEGNILLEKAKNFTKGQQKILDSMEEIPPLFYFDRMSVCGKNRWCLPHLPLHCFTRQMFNDGRGEYGRSRNHFGNIVIDGVPYKATPRIAFRIQGFPDWYEIPDAGANIWGSIVGNSVPPLFAQQLFSRTVAAI